MDKNNQLETAPIGKLVFKLAIPTVMAQLVNLLYNIVDRIYVGRIPEIGSLSLAGLGVTFPIILLVSAFAMLAGMGGASRAAVSMGEKDNDKAEKILGNCTMLLIIFSVVLAVVFMLTKNQILMKFGASEATLPYASDYISIYLVGTIFVQIALGLNLFITNQGFAKTSMMTVCIGAVLNIVLDPIFIYVFRMGVKGAALATIISSLGVSPFIMQATECLIQLTFNNGMLKYGNDLYVALMSILFSLTQLIWMPLNGFSQGAQPVIGYNYGAKRFDRVKKAFKLQFTVSICFSLFAVALVEVFPTAFLKMFTNDQELIDIGINSTRLFLAGMSVMGAQCACQQTFLALGEAKISMFLACLRKIILLFPLALILPNIANMGVWGLLLAEPVSDVVAASCTTIMFTIRSRKILKQ